MKKMLSLLLVLCMLFALGACASGGEATEPTDSGSDASAVPTEETGYTGSADFDVSKYAGTTIDIMWQESDSTQIDTVTNFAQPAIEEQFGEYIDVNWIGNVDTNVNTLAQTDQLADIWYGVASIEMIDSGIVLDLTDYLTVDSYLEDHYSNPDLFYFRDHIWAQATGVNNFYTGTLYCNQDIFDELGITSIATYDELYAAYEKCLAAGYTPLTVDGNNNSSFTRFLFQALIVSVDPIAFSELVVGNGDLDSEAVTQAVQLIADMRDAGFLGQGTSVKTTSESISSFVEGKAATLYTDSWNNGSVAEAPFNVTVAWWPTANDEYPTGKYMAGYETSLTGWIGNSETENPELVVEIIKCLVKAEAARHLNAGLVTSYFQDGAAVPINDLEEQRAALYGQIETWYSSFDLACMDSVTRTEVGNQIATLLSDDNYPVASFISAVQAVWETNTYFG